MSHAESGKLSSGSPHVAPALLTRMCESVGVGGDEVGEAQAFVVPGKVCGNGSHVAELGQVVLGLRARVGLAGADDDARACLQQTAGHHHADAAGAAGDEGGLAGQVEKFCVRRGLAVCHWLPSIVGWSEAALGFAATGRPPADGEAEVPGGVDASRAFARASGWDAHLLRSRARRVTPRSGSGGFATVSSRPSR